MEKFWIIGTPKVPGDGSLGGQVKAAQRGEDEAPVQLGWVMAADQHDAVELSRRSATINLKKYVRLDARLVLPEDHWFPEEELKL